MMRVCWPLVGSRICLPLALCSCSLLMRGWGERVLQPVEGDRVWHASLKSAFQEAMPTGLSRTSHQAAFQCLLIVIPPRSIVMSGFEETVSLQQADGWL